MSGKPKSSLSAALSGHPVEGSTAIPAMPPISGGGGIAINHNASSAQAVPFGSLRNASLFSPSSLKGGVGRNASFKSSLGTSTYLESRKDDDAFELSRASLNASLSSSVSLTQAEKMFAQIPQSPHVSHMDKIPPKRIRDPTDAGQKLRRQLLRDAVIVFVTAGYGGKRFVFEKAKELGVRSVILEAEDSWAKALEAEGVIEKFISVDMGDAERVLESMMAGIQRVQQEYGRVDGVTTFCEMAVPLVCRLGEMYNLPTNPFAAVELARNKHAFRQAIRDAGLPSPASYLIKDDEEIEAAAAHVGFPAVIKPVNGAASLGVVRVNDTEELREAYRRVKKEMSMFKITSGALEASEEVADEDHTANGWINFEIMVEEYLDGVEVDCDMILAEGEVVYGAVTDNWPTIEPWFNETGSNCPSVLDEKKQMELLELSANALKALGMKLGVFHVEAKYTSRGARLIEVNSRMGGGPVRLTNLLVWGVDLVEEHLMASIGIPVRPPAAKEPLKYIAEYSINAPKSGVIEHDQFISKWAGHPDVIYARPLVSGGDKVTGPQDGLPTWLAEIMVQRATVQEAIDFVDQVARETPLPIV